MITHVKRVFEQVSGFVKKDGQDVLDTGTLEIKLTQVGYEYYSEVVFYGTIVPVSIVSFEVFQTPRKGYAVFENALTHYANA